MSTTGVIPGQPARRRRECAEISLVTGVYIDRAVGGRDDEVRR
jgi:hypothetical protein